MCGRFHLTATADALAELFQLITPPDWLPRYNIAPTQQIPIVREQIRFKPFPNNIDPAFILSINSGSFALLRDFLLTDSVGGILELDTFDVSFQVFRSFSVVILFDSTLPVLPGSGTGSPNPNSLPGQWIVHV